MGAEREDEQAAGRPRSGRPTRASDEARSHRVVTFVTTWEQEGLEQIAQEEERSLSAVVHRIIAYYLRNVKPTENEGRANET